MTNLLLNLPIELLTPLLEQFVKNEDFISLANLARTCCKLRDAIQSLLWYILKYMTQKHAALFVRNRTSSWNDRLFSICVLHEPDNSDYTITNIRNYRNFSVKPTPLRRIHNSTPCQRFYIRWATMRSDHVNGFVDYHHRAQNLMPCNKYTRYIFFQNKKVVGWSSNKKDVETPSLLYFCDPPVYTDSEVQFASYVCPNTDKVALIFVEQHYGEYNVHRHYYTKHNVILVKIKKGQVITFE